MARFLGECHAGESAPMCFLLDSISLSPLKKWLRWVRRMGPFGGIVREMAQGHTTRQRRCAAVIEPTRRGRPRVPSPHSIASSVHRCASYPLTESSPNPLPDKIIARAGCQQSEIRPGTVMARKAARRCETWTWRGIFFTFSFGGCIRIEPADRRNVTGLSHGAGVAKKSFPEARCELKFVSKRC